MPKPKSKQQAAYLGLIAAGDVRNPRINQGEAKAMLRGVKVKALPKKVKKR
jgi:hypothetical protein